LKCLALADLFITTEMMEKGLTNLKDAGIEVTVREWKHDNLERLQQDNLAIEQGGSEMISLPQHLLEDIDKFDIIITQFAPINKNVIEKAKKLKIIGVLRGGIENINKSALEERGVCIINTPGRNSRSVAEFTIGLILSEIRNIARSHEALKQGNWRKDFPNANVIPELEGRTIGIIGYGNIGQLVARFINVFGTRVIFHDPYFKGETSFEHVDLDTLLKESDIVTLHGRLTNETHHLLKEKHLKMMKRTAILINTSRSGLIKEEDLITALKNKVIMGAAIDTFDHEHLDKNSPFLELDNVTITSHMAGSTNDAFKNTPKKLALRLLENLQHD